MGFVEILKFEKKSIITGAYDDRENLAWEMLKICIVLVYSLNAKPLGGEE